MARSPARAAVFLSRVVISWEPQSSDTHDFIRRGGAVEGARKGEEGVWSSLNSGSGALPRVRFSRAGSSADQ